jgi:tetratricopeptide (TPR) repeat protein
VLEGSLQKADNMIRITAQLINVVDESVLWSDQYNREEDHIFDIQDEIALAIVNELKVALVGADQENLKKRYTENVEAYNLYLQGRFFWNKRTEEGLTKAIEYFKQAIEKDPNYSLAYAGLADSYLVSSAWHYMLPLEAYPKAKEAALKSLKIDDLLAEAHTALASVYMDYEWEWEKAEKEFKRAIELNPSYATAHHWYLEYLAVMGDFNEAIREGKRALELDPLSPMINASLGSTLSEMGELDRALVQLQNTIEMHPDFKQVRYYLGQVYLRKGMYKEALTEFNTAGNLAYAGITYTKLGNEEEARKLLENLKRESKETNVSFKQIAELHFSLGDYDQGFVYLEKAYEKREFFMKFIKNDFMDDDKIRSDPRFKALLKKMHLD